VPKVSREQATRKSMADLEKASRVGFAFIIAFRSNWQ
jgi:hypothetical protein